MLQIFEFTDFFMDKWVSAIGVKRRPNFHVLTLNFTPKSAFTLRQRIIESGNGFDNSLEKKIVDFCKTQHIFL